MARQYVRNVISSIQRVAMAISPSGLSPAGGPKLSPGSPEAHLHWLTKSARATGAELLRSESLGGESILATSGCNIVLFVEGLLLSRFADKGLTYRITSNPIEKSIVWTITVPEHISEGIGWMKSLPVFNFANQAGLDMLETTLAALQDITLVTGYNM
ncbi:hypothetical protein REPUB_Repub06bG0138600 [Reevesia pubescens]